MPKNVRNSWVTIQVDGRASSTATGPAAKDGTMTAEFFVRNKGSIRRSITVQTCADGNRLTLEVRDPRGEVIFTHKTKR